MTDEVLMQLAIDQAVEALRAGEPPFGVVLVAGDGTVLAAGYDTVRGHGDWTRHAEIETVRAACRAYGPNLIGSTLVTTVEPCPMCFTAAWLARVSRVVFGASMADVFAATAGQQRELSIPTATINQLSPAPIQLDGGIRREECLAFFQRGSARDAA
jgi:tRNA(Arg) A34 adenosine deaminase TadA